MQRLLGHKNLKTTLRYTQLVDYPHEEQFICKAAKTVKETTELIENGFEHVTDMNNIALFRKRQYSFLESRPLQLEKEL